MPDDSESGMGSQDLGISPSERVTLKDFFADMATRPATGRVGDPIIAGGQLITPKASRSEDRNPDGTINFNPSRQKGFLTAISEASRAEISDDQKAKDIQEIVDAAKAAGVPREEIGQHLKSLGISNIKAEEASLEGFKNTQVDELYQLIESVKSGVKSPQALQEHINHLLKQGFDREEIGRILNKKGVTAQKREDQVEAIDLQKPLNGRTYNQLFERFNEVVARLKQEGNKGVLDRLFASNIPIGRIWNGPFPGGDTIEARQAYYDIKKILDDIEGKK